MLLEKPSDVQMWSGPYIERLPLDPWGGDYIYHDLGKGQVEIVSYGSDRTPGGTGWAEDIRTVFEPTIEKLSLHPDTQRNNRK